MSGYYNIIATVLKAGGGVELCLLACLPGSNDVI